MWETLLMTAGRVIYGWGKNSLEDGAIQKVEWQKLGVNMLKIGAIAVFLYYGTEGLNVNFSMEESLGSSVLLDVLRNDLIEPIFKKRK